MKTFDSDQVKQLEKAISQTKLDPRKTPPEPPYFLKVGEIPVASFENFSLLTGKAKSRKSFLSGFIAAVCLDKNQTGGDVISMSNEYKVSEVYYIDTEQSEFHTYRLFDCIKIKIGLQDFSKLHLHNLRPYSNKARIAIIEYLLQNAPPYSLFIIDGIRDLISKINDEEEAIKLANIFLEYTQKKSLHILGVLHENKYNNEARGHLGSEMVHKAETVFSVRSLDKNSSIVKAAQTRGLSFNDFYLIVDENGIPNTSLVNPKKSNANVTKKRPEEVDDHLHSKVISDLKQTLDMNANRKTLLPLLKKAIKKHIEEVGNNLTSDYLNYYIDKELIKKEGADRSTKAYYTIPDP
tara:strand:- start:32949 stop:34001 length:1053 start_codon:yes stop_codon:yes gene_type:complete